MKKGKLSDRDIRQRDILPPERLKEISATVIGVGAIGRQCALQLAAVGVGELVLCDPDTVGVENLAAQGFLEEEVGVPKVEAVGALCERMNSQIRINMAQSLFNRNVPVGDAVFCCVDKIDARKFIFKLIKDKTSFFVDGRMAAETMRILATGALEKDAEHYDKTIFDEGEAFQGSCTAKTTIYCANVAAGLMLNCFTQWLRNIRPPLDFLVNLLSMEIVFPEDLEV